MDEHGSALHTLIVPTSRVELLLNRYMDDLNCLAASSIPDLHIHTKINHYIQFNLYDQLNKHLTVNPQDDNNFLDAVNVISDDGKSVKLVYNNKNSPCMITNAQVIGRFHQADAPSPMQFKLSAAHCILIKIHDYTTLFPDMFLPGIALVHELRTLGYPDNFIASILVKANRSRPSHFWHLLLGVVTH